MEGVAGQQVWLLIIYSSCKYVRGDCGGTCFIRSGGCWTFLRWWARSSSSVAVTWQALAVTSVGLGVQTDGSEDRWLQSLGIVRTCILTWPIFATWTQFIAKSVAPEWSLSQYHWTSEISQGPQCFQSGSINHPCSNVGLIHTFKSIWSWQTVRLPRATSCLKLILQWGLLRSINVPKLWGLTCLFYVFLCIMTKTNLGAFGALVSTLKWSLGTLSVNALKRKDLNVQKMR